MIHIQHAIPDFSASPHREAKLKRVENTDRAEAQLSYYSKVSAHAQRSRNLSSQVTVTSTVSSSSHAVTG